MKLEIVFKDGRKETFHGVASFNVTQSEGEKSYEFDIAQKPIEGKLFKVNPLTINRSLFKREMISQRQERIRQIIIEAFAEVDKNPKKYAIPFFTLIPEKKWDEHKKVSELEEYAVYLGGYMANWVEQALEWAQRISNGESWRNVCNDNDTTKWYRIVKWKNGCYRRIGGATSLGVVLPASNVGSYTNFSNHRVRVAVPLVVFREK